MAAIEASKVNGTSDNGQSPNHLNHDPVALIHICGHVLHDSCLREWTEKANSCPICRQAFHLVHVYDKVGGESSPCPPCTAVQLLLTDRC